MNTPPHGVRRGTLLNLLGQGLPLVAAVLSVPSTVRALGLERFGILALGWGILSAFSVLDLALGRAVTRFASAALARGDGTRLRALLALALRMQLAVGVAGGSLLAAAAFTGLATRLLSIPAPLASEAAGAFAWLALSIPATLASGCYRALLEALRRFDLVNLGRGPAGAATFLVPLVGAVLGWSLPAIAAALVLSRLALLAAYALMVRRALGLAPAGPSPSLSFGELARYGGWVAAGNGIPALINLADRALVGRLVSLAAVSYFSVPMEIIYRFWALPTSLMGALFPEIAAAGSVGDGRALAALAARGARGILLLLGIPLAAAALLAPLWMELWLSADFAHAGSTVFRVLAAGMLVAALGGLATAELQAIGRPDVAARWRLLELPLALAAQWWLIGRWGIQGAAAGWSARAALDAALMWWSVRRLRKAAGASN